MIRSVGSGVDVEGTGVLCVPQAAKRRDIKKRTKMIPRGACFCDKAVLRIMRLLRRKSILLAKSV
jgi:hypothetical protein